MLIVQDKLESPRASFSTHLNYVKCVAAHFEGSTLRVVVNGTPAIRRSEIRRFQKLDLLTAKSISVDMSLAESDSAFAVIAAPWFGVKCYYSLYYQESVLAHIIDGTLSGFTKGGHGAIRKKISQLIATSALTFSDAEINIIRQLSDICRYPRISPGRNTSSYYWKDPSCTQSIARKLSEYMLHDRKVSEKWNLHRKKDQQEKAQYIEENKLTLTDFFYWYRIKANYRDLDYIDFEKGIGEGEVFEYMSAYNRAYTSYHRMLTQKIATILRTRN